MIAAASPLRVFHPSNSLTYASLLSAMTAIASAAQGQRAAAAALIALAVILDTFDGRFARLFHRSGEQREIGVELDSLSDAVAFGLAPAMCVGLSPAVGFVFCACAVSRLAFYNVTHDQRPGFIGMPVPVAALLLVTWSQIGTGWGSNALALVASVTMIAPIPFPRPAGAGLAAFVAWPLLLIATTVVSGLR